MTTPTGQTSGTTLATLLNGLRAHLQDCPLPEPTVLTLDLPTRRISIQAGGGRDAIEQLGELLLWAYTLDQPTADWWHTPNGTLHITTEGRSVTGINFSVYISIPFDHCAGLVSLAPDASEDVSLDELYMLRTLLREHHNPTTGEVIA